MLVLERKMPQSRNKSSVLNVNVPYNSSVVSSGIGKPALQFLAKGKDISIKSKTIICHKSELTMIKKWYICIYEIKKQNRRKFSLETRKTKTVLTARIDV